MKKTVLVILTLVFLIVQLNMLVAAVGPITYKYLYPINVGGKWGYIDSKGKVIVKPQYTEAREFSDSLGAVCSIVKGNQKWGFLDSSGKVIVKPKYDIADDFHEGMAAVKVGGPMSGVIFIDSKGKEVLKVKDSEGYFADPSGFNGGCIALYLSMHLSTDVRYIDKRGNIISTDHVLYPENYIYQYRAGLRKTKGQNGKIGYINASGKMEIEPKYDKGMDFYINYAWVRKDNRWILIERPDKELASTEYQIVSEYKNGFAKIQNGLWDVGKWGYIDKLGNMVITPKYNYAFDFSEGLAAVKLKGIMENAIGISDGGIEYIGKSGNTEIIPAFEFAEAFEDGLAYAYINKEHVFIDKTGKTVFKAFSPYSGFSEDYVVTRLENDKYQYLDKEGRPIGSNVYDDAYSFKEGLARVVQGGKYGFIDTKGNTVIEPKYTYANDFSEGLALVGENGKYSYIDKSGKAAFIVTDVSIIQYSGVYSDGDNCYGVEVNSDFHDGLAAVKINNRTGYIDRSGKLAILPQFDLASCFSEGYAVARRGYEYGYIDKSGKFVIRSQFSIGPGFKDGMAVIFNKIGKYKLTAGFIDKTGNIIMYPQFDEVGAFNDGLARVKTGYYSGKIGLVGIKGNVVVQPKYEDIGFPSENLTAVMIDKKWGYMDIDCNIIIAPQFEEAGEYKGGIGKVLLNGKNCYVDKNGKFIWKQAN